MLYYERKFKQKGFSPIIGIDEAGRGPLAGPVVAAAVTLNKTRFKNRIDDSKKLSAKQREKAFGEIIAKSTFAVGIVSEKMIDQVNILVATTQAMEDALLCLMYKLSKVNKEKPCVLIDGQVKLSVSLPCVNIIKGDSKSLSIACASIVAKVVRDQIMRLYDKLYPEYGFFRHQGYGTQLHRCALEKHGPCLIHRKTFLRCLKKT